MEVKLYELRKSKNLTQLDLAKFLGISHTTYRNKELGRTDFSATEMFKLADFFKEDIGKIFKNKAHES